MNKSWEKHENFFIKKCRYFQRLGPNLPIISRYLKAALNSRLMVKMVEEKGFNLVHTHTPLDFALAGLTFARTTKIPCIYEVHTLYSDEVAHRKRTGIPRIFNRLAKQIAKFQEAKIIRQACCTIVQTSTLKQRIVSLYHIPEDKIRIIPNGIDANMFCPYRFKSIREKLRKERGWAGKKIILYSGYLDWINGIDFLLKTVAGLPQETKHKIKLVFAGNGPLTKLVRQEAKKASSFIEYLGQIAPDSMPALYSSSDIFVIPRPPTEAGECLVPIKLLEAMAMEKIVLVSDLTALRKVVGENKYGVTFRRGDSRDLQQKLKEIINESDKFRLLGEKARKKVVSEYSWDESRAKLRELYRELNRSVPASSQ